MTIKSDLQATLRQMTIGKNANAVAYNGGFNPTVVEKFDNKTDADSYAALMCRAKQRRYIVLEQVTEWDGTPQENAWP